MLVILYRTSPHISEAKAMVWCGSLSLEFLCWEEGASFMKAVRIHQFGGPEVLTYEDIPDPQPRKDQVLVRVKACALNHLDVWVRKGLPGVNLPHILGSDIAGEIAEVGEYVTGFQPGQRVLVA